MSVLSVDHGVLVLAGKGSEGNPGGWFAFTGLGTGFTNGTIATVKAPSPRFR